MKITKNVFLFFALFSWGYVSAIITTDARAHNSNTSNDAEHLAKHLVEINDTLKKIERKLK